MEFQAKEICRLIARHWEFAEQYGEPEVASALSGILREIAKITGDNTDKEEARQRLVEKGILFP